MPRTHTLAFPAQNTRSTSAAGAPVAQYACPTDQYHLPGTGSLSRDGSSIPTETA